MKKPINTDLDRLNITGQKDPDWLYSGASGRNKDVVNNLEHFNNAIGDYEEIAPLELHGLVQFETGGPTGATPYTPTQRSEESFFGTGWLNEFFSDMERNAGKSAEADMRAMGLIGAGSIKPENLAQQKLLPTPRSAQESTAGFKPKAGSWLSGALTSAANVASKLISGATAGAGNAVTDNTVQQGGAASGAGNTDSGSGKALLIAGGIGLAVMAIIGTVIIVKSRANK